MPKNRNSRFRANVTPDSKSGPHKASNLTHGIDVIDAANKNKRLATISVTRFQKKK